MDIWLWRVVRVVESHQAGVFRPPQDDKALRNNAEEGAMHIPRWLVVICLLKDRHRHAGSRWSDAQQHCLGIYWMNEFLSLPVSIITTEIVLDN
jgi:hypothetical protein